MENSIVGTEHETRDDTVVVVKPNVEGMNSLRRRKNKSAGWSTGVSLGFTGITFEVRNKQGQSKKKILENVEGFVKGGGMMYLMGPSGAGKTALLDALADRVKARVGGEVLVNGNPKDSSRFKYISKYVPQEDHHIPVLTVRQTLMCSALLYTTDTSLARERVDYVLELLGLQAEESVIIGGPLLRGISGGQKRRVSIGCELVASPLLMFLDEPTSGLDSAAAWRVICALYDVSRSVGTTLVLTIHQPSERLFRLSDDFLLLSAGQVAYAGPTTHAVQHFQQLSLKGENKESWDLPPMTSAIEWMLELVDTSFNERSRVEPILNAWETSEAANTLRCSTAEQRDTKVSSLVYPTMQTPFLWQTYVLAWRMSINAIKNPAVIWLRFFMYILLSVMLSSTWYDIGSKEESIMEILNVIFFIQGFMVFMSVSVLPSFLEEKAVFVKERANGAYGTLPFNLAHTLVDLPPLAIVALACSSICYFVIGLNNASGRFLFFVVDLFMCFVAAEAFMFLVAVIVPSFIAGLAVASCIYGGFLMCMGFFIRIDNIPWVWRWMHLISIHKYGFSSAVHNELTGRVFTCGESTMWSCDDDNLIRGEKITEFYEYDTTKKWQNMGVLLALAVGYRALSVVYMHFVHTGKR